MRILVMGPSSHYLSFLHSSLGITSEVAGRTAVDASIEAIIDNDREARLVLITLSSLLTEVSTVILDRMTIIGVPERTSAKSKILTLYSSERRLITREVKRQSFERILVHWIYEYALAIPRRLATRTVLVVHDAPLRVTYLAPSWMRVAKVLMAIVTRIKLHNARFVAVSRYTAEQIRKEMFLFRTIDLLPNVLTYSDCSKVSEKRPFTILCIANDSNLKDVKSLIEAHRELIAYYPTLSTRFVGPGLEFNSTFAEKQGLLEGIEWMGKQGSSDLFNLIRESFLVVSCSKEESFGLTCLEALYLGTKFVTRNPLPSFLEIGDSNPLFISSTPATFFKDLVMILGTPYDQDSSSASRSTIELLFGKLCYVDRLKAIFYAN